MLSACPRPPIPTSPCATTCGCSASCSGKRSARGKGRRFALVERVRALAKSARAGDEQRFRHAGGRARRHAGRRGPAGRARLLAVPEPGQHRRAAPPHPAPPRLSAVAGSAAAARLVRRDVRPADRRRADARPSCCDAVCSLEIELVLTAHPTEIVRRTLLQKYDRIARALAEKDRPDLTVWERETVVETLRREIAACWETDEIRRVRPTPLDEVRGGLLVFEQTLWQALPRYLRELDRALTQHTGSGLPLEVSPIRFGTWIGGDRDGNPNVTPDVTRQAVLLGRWMAADLYFREVDLLRSELSMAHASAELRARVGEAEHEPYRALLRDVRERLLATRKWAEGDPRGSAQRRHRRRSRPAPGPTSTSRPRRWPSRCGSAIARCARPATASSPTAGSPTSCAASACFGLTLARLDIRQESDAHTAALDAITRALGLGSYAEWSEEERQQFLMRELGGRRPLVPPHLEASPEVQDVFDTFRMLARLPSGFARRLHHHDGVGAVGRARRGAAAARGRRRAAAARRAAGRDRRRPAPGRLDAAPAAVGAVVPRAHQRPPGSDDRLLGLGQGRRPVRRRLGALQGAGGDRRGVPRHRRPRHAVPRPRRQRRPRRRADLHRHPVAAAGLGRRPHPRHRAGRDDPGEVRPRGHRRPHARDLHDGDARGEPDAGPPADRRGARADGGDRLRLADGLSRPRLRSPALRRVLPRRHARARAGAAQHRQPAVAAARRPAPASSRCARSRGSSPGRRRGCCWRRGSASTAPSATRWPAARATRCARCIASGRSSARRST